MNSNSQSAELAGLHEDVTAVIRYLLSLTDGMPSSRVGPDLDDAVNHARNIQDFLDSFQLVVNEYRSFQQLTQALSLSDPRLAISASADDPSAPHISLVVDFVL
ncbi:hypothetical protein POJ06DRAFT_266694 [Lipomyces tetrasporus]|uniref:Uncharacterized protein n=1 Tax=Lipomyces tetrasporus TaxID=54092 RepID=A0AAD7VU24_9ASCO|nr:uncharacterized protein POJ06DRAFT_266694 [Lipomyces tetrasporus]KAJ8102083.1 hypothetical protein POJ06DRAFT_266694 [Lipomyces tetrasporus]